MKKVSVFDILIATGFGSGFSPVAPGTAGAILATVIWWILSCFLTTPALCVTTAALIVVFTILGIYTTNKVETIWGEDPSRVVVDEMVGVWIPLLIVSANDPFWLMLLAFVLFRLFDIFKPLGIRKMEDFKGGTGVMMDDILAGIYSLILLALIKWVIG